VLRLMADPPHPQERDLTAQEGRAPIRTAGIVPGPAQGAQRGTAQ